jgi:sortase B
MNKITVIIIVMIFVCLGVGCFGLYKINTENEEIARAEEQAEQYTPYSPSAFFESGGEYEGIYNQFAPKLQELQAVNSDVIGWIYFPQTHIDYPLLQGSDNSYYLTHTVSGEYSVSGSVFVDSRGTGNANTVIYAHNMGRRSNIMFHDVTNFVDKAWFEKVKTGYIITAEGIQTLNIFAYALTKPQTDFYADEVSLEYIKSNATNYREVDFDKMVTLSTCAYDYKDARAVLCCAVDWVFER